MSPYKSIQEVAKDHIGKFLGHLPAERYKNTELISEAKCPILIIHGQLDQTVSLSHSEALQQCCNTNTVCKLVTPSTMDHNTFTFEVDLIKPLTEFLYENSIDLH